ncbi:restriction endonuclease subunit S [Sphingomonas sp. MJ1 (PH-R8)]|uniref:restriction endonuclease subunit S n=1 Tax=Sphingomonas sp. MJ1 (PH-R8) TaxID=3112950 RepID=UPI003A87FA04
MKNVLEELAVTIFRSQFVKFEGCSRFDESELGDVPHGWRVCELGELLDVLETGSRPAGGVKEFNSGMPSIGAESIIGLGKFDYAKTKFVPVSFFEKMRRGHIQDMDVLVYKDGGKPGQFEPHISIFGAGFPYEQASINEHVYRARVKPPLTQAFLYFWLTTPLMMEEMRRRGTGVAIPGLNSTAVKELPIIVPPSDVVQKFDAIAEPIIRKLLIEATPTFPLPEATRFHEASGGAAAA